MVVGDPVLFQMAVELRAALVKVGADPSDPPTGSAPPADRAYAEYLKRGGTVYEDKDLFVKSLVESVASM